jgi:hypothetical protein
VTRRITGGNIRAGSLDEDIDLTPRLRSALVDLRNAHTQPPDEAVVQAHLRRLREVSDTSTPRLAANA